MLLVAILEAAAENYVTFNPEDFGIKLPTTLSAKVNSAGPDLPDLVSPTHNMLANIAVELWLRNANRVLRFENRTHIGVEKNTGLDPELESDLQKLQGLEKMADFLFAGQRENLVKLVRENLRKEHGYVPEQPDDMLIKGDMSIVMELISRPGTTMGKTDIRHLTANNSRVNSILFAITKSLREPGLANQLDTSLIGQSRILNLSRYGGAFRDHWLQRLEQFNQAHRQFVQAFDYENDN